MYTTHFLFVSIQSKTSYNYSYFKKDIIIEENDLPNQSKIWTSAHVFTGCCFKRQIIPIEFLKGLKLNWYPSQLIFGLLTKNLGYIGEPLAMHIWENELFWDTTAVPNELLTESVIDGLKIALDYTHDSKRIEYFANQFANQLLKNNGFDQSKIPQTLINLMSKEDIKDFYKIRPPKPSLYVRVINFLKKGKRKIHSFVPGVIKDSDY